MKTAMLLAALILPQLSSASELYSDEWVQGMARMEIGPSQSAINLRQPILDVVPIGQSLKISQIFERLNIDPKRVVSKGSEQVMNVTFYEWQLSNNYLLSIMSGSMRGESPPPERAWDMQGYGVRIVRVHAK